MPKASYIKCKFCEGTGKEVDFFDLPETPLIPPPLSKSPHQAEGLPGGNAWCVGEGGKYLHLPHRRAKWPDQKKT